MAAVEPAVHGYQRGTAKGIRFACMIHLVTKVYTLRNNNALVGLDIFTAEVVDQFLFFIYTHIHTNTQTHTHTHTVHHILTYATNAYTRAGDPCVN